MHLIDGWRSFRSAQRVSFATYTLAEYAGWSCLHYEKTHMMTVGLAFCKMTQTVYCLWMMRVAGLRIKMIACPLFALHLYTQYKRDPLYIKVTAFFFNVVSKIINSFGVGLAIHHMFYGDQKHRFLMWGTTAAMLGIAALNLKEDWEHLKGTKNANT